MKRVKRAMFVFVLFCLTVVVVPTSAHAAKLVQLKTNRTYTSYDVTRDGKKDKIRIVQTASYAKNGETKMRVSVNGKKKFTAKGCKGCAVYLFQSGKRSVLLSEFIFGDGGRAFYGYSYSGGTFKKKEIGPRGFFFGEVKRSGNDLKVYAEPKGTWWLKSFSSFSENPFRAVDTYRLSGGLLKKVNSYPAISGTKTYYAVSSFSTGKTIASVSSGNGPSVRAGQKVTLKAISYRSKEFTYYYKISVNGKTGWFRDSESIRFTR